MTKINIDNNSICDELAIFIANSIDCLTHSSCTDFTTTPEFQDFKWLNYFILKNLKSIVGMDLAKDEALKSYSVDLRLILEAYTKLYIRCRVPNYHIHHRPRLKILINVAKQHGLDFSNFDDSAQVYLNLHWLNPHIHLDERDEFCSLPLPERLQQAKQICKISLVILKSSLELLFEKFSYDFPAFHAKYSTNLYGKRITCANFWNYCIEIFDNMYLSDKTIIHVIPCSELPPYSRYFENY